MSETDNLFKAYSVQEIASMLGIGKTKTRELLDSGILPVTKVGRQYFTSPASIQEFSQEKHRKANILLGPLESYCQSGLAILK